MSLDDFQQVRYGDSRLFGELLRLGLATELSLQMLRGLDNLVSRFNSVNRDADDPPGIDEASGNALANPPARVGGKAVAQPVVEFLDGPHQSEISFLNQVQKS